MTLVFFLKKCNKTMIQIDQRKYSVTFTLQIFRIKYDNKTLVKFCSKCLKIMLCFRAMLINPSPTSIKCMIPVFVFSRSLSSRVIFSVYNMSTKHVNPVDYCKNTFIGTINTRCTTMNSNMFLLLSPTYVSYIYCLARHG